MNMTDGKSEQSVLHTISLKAKQNLYQNVLSVFITYIN